MSNSARRDGNDPIDPRMTVNQVIERFPQTVRIFSARGIDSCCGGSLSVGTAARRHGIDVDRLLAALRRHADEVS